MARTESELVSSFGTAFEIFKGLAAAVLDLGGDEDDLRWVLRDEQLCRSIAALIIDRKKAATYPVIVNYDMTLAGMIAVGRYDYVNPDITDKRFPREGVGSVKRTVVLVHFDHHISKDDVLRELDQRELRPAKIEDILALGAAYPELQRKFPIAALGSVWRDPFGRRYVPCLRGRGADRGLDTHWFGLDRRGGWRFAAVSK